LTVLKKDQKNASVKKTCFFVSDLHGNTDRYEKLFGAILEEHPISVFMGGDILPSRLAALSPGGKLFNDFVNDFLAVRCRELKKSLRKEYPRFFLILGNDDPRIEEGVILAAAKKGLWEYIHNRRAELLDFSVYGYSYVPPTPFQLKDWERYDVSRFVDVGCVSPEEGMRSVPVSGSEMRNSNIEADLEKLASHKNLSKSIFLFHAPPYQTKLDRAALDGKFVDHVPLDVHVGSIAVRRFIESSEPFLTLHGHVHESARLTGSWKDKIGKTHMFSAAHDGPELAVVRFELDRPEAAVRELI